MSNIINHDETFYIPETPQQEATRKLYNDWLKDGLPVASRKGGGIDGAPTGTVDAIRVIDLVHPLFGLFKKP